MCHLERAENGERDKRISKKSIVVIQINWKLSLPMNYADSCKDAVPELLESLEVPQEY